MVAKRVDAGNSNSRRPPAKTPEDREKQLVALAYDQAEKQLSDGSASAQVITHFLKIGGVRERLELEKLRKENLLTQARIDQSAKGDKMEDLLTKAMDAFTEYRGLSVMEEDDAE